MIEYLEAIARESFRKYESRFDFQYLTDLDMPALLERLKHLPDDTIVYHTSLMQDASGARFIDATQSVPLIASASNAPVFVVDDVDLGGGTAGGDLLSWTSDGRVVGEMAVRVLNGEKPQDIPIVKSANVYMFDWRALKRWGLRGKRPSSRQHRSESAAHRLGILQVVHHWRDCSDLGRSAAHFCVGLAAGSGHKGRNRAA